MIDINLIRENKDIVKENIKKKFQDNKLPLVDEVYDLDIKYRETKSKADQKRSEKNKLSAEIGSLVRDNNISALTACKEKIGIISKEIEDLEVIESDLEVRIKDIMMRLPNIIDATVPIGKTDKENVELNRHGKIRNIDFDIPYHADIMENLSGLDLDSARRISGNGFYFLIGDIARLHSAILIYARDFMIDKGFTYCIPPFMLNSDAVNGVMSFEEKDNMMYKIEGEDLYLIGTSEHSMISRFKDQIIDEDKLPIMLTSYSPCFRKEVGAHGIEERGIYRVHQFEKQEMIVICKKEDEMDFYNKLWNYSVEFFESLDIPHRTIECCSGDLADLKEKSLDLEAWSPRQKAYFGELGSCSVLGDAQARRLAIRVKGKEGKYYPSTLNNTVVAPPRMLIAFLENNINKDGSINIPKVLRPYMGNKEIIKKAESVKNFV